MDNTATPSALNKAELETLETRLKSAWHFLQHTHTTAYLSQKQITLDKLPWYLLIGPAQSGKTQLIKQAGIKLIAANHLATDPRDEGEGNKHCNFWFSDEATFIDTPGNYFEINTNQNELTANQQFLNLLKKYTTRKPLSGIVVVIDLVTWSTKNKTGQQKFAEQLKQNLLNISQTLKARCPVYLVFTHVDCIKGFSEFFAELGQEEREQPWGITFSEQINPSNFKNYYDRLLKRLHERVIWRMQHERNADRRINIQSFPTRMETLKEGLANTIYQLSDVFTPHGTLSFEGIYFVSNLQTGNIIDNLHKAEKSNALTAKSQENLATLKTQQITSAYFSHRLFKKIILDHQFLPQQPQLEITISRHAYWIAAGLVLLSGIFFTYSYFAKTSSLGKAQVALAEYREAIQNVSIHDRDLNRNLSALKHLQDASNLLHQAHLPWLLAQGFHLPSLQASTDNIYHTELNARFLPSLASELEQTLATNQDPNILYNTLKVYLMLGMAEHFDKTFVQNWLSAYWQQNFKHDPLLQQQLNAHLSVLLANPIAPIALNQTAIARARNTLNNTNPTQLAFAILKNQMVQTQFNPLLANQSDKNIYKEIFPGLEKNPGIASIYTANQFQTIYFQQIKRACEIASQGDWVTGQKNASSADSDELIRSVQIIYLKNYALTWQTFLNSLQIAAPTDGKQLLSLLDTLLGRHSPLISVLKIVSNNTELTHLLPADKTFPKADLNNIQMYLVTPFADLDDFMHAADNKNSSGLDHILVTVKSLYNFLDNIVSAKNSKKAAYELAKQKFTSISQKSDPIDDISAQAETLPQPIQSWVHQIAINSWKYILHETGNYFADAWQAEVIPEYNAKINNRYPIFKNASTDMTLSQFTHFFGPGGTINNYFKNYLAPFVDVTKPAWEWRISHEGKIDLSNNFLMQLERSAIIKIMFFNSDAELQVNFALRPISFGPAVKEFQFVMGTQNFTDKRWSKTKHTLNWPANEKTAITSVTFTDADSQKHNMSFIGPWGLFRLLDKNQINPQEESDRRFQITFDVNGQSTKYELIPNNIINPFMPNIITEFRCPVNLR